MIKKKKKFPIKNFPLNYKNSKLRNFCRRSNILYRFFVINFKKNFYKKIIVQCYILIKILNCDTKISNYTIVIL